MKTVHSRSRSKLFPTPDDAENAFYDAFERGDLAAMMAVWAEADDIVCVHPQGPRLVGFEAVRESWAQIFAGATQMRVQTAEAHRFDGPTVAVHSLVEVVGPAGGGASGSVHATNVYELTEGGWRMVVHHASPMAEAPATEEPPAPAHTLH
jgi:uncharacterized protein (TIGR02246 family)